MKRILITLALSMLAAPASAFTVGSAAFTASGGSPSPGTILSSSLDASTSIRG